ncbi:hypothetical protein K432DRAFT_286364 [Lepidopterella palustris CBS 459.81]|uniref:F-box domain-containing protein n=1 Tax=Lepidopterella palustris CBS 459.81 TaxID=1314670 RepID=A0A8E2EKX4_9PEZI|nr:hypothetical protein K432DRAFT_286364 [Lepidopterella palustris CBS 459.81]
MAHPNIPVAIPTQVLQTSPVHSQTSLAQRTDIPLHILALIISYIDDVADIARLTRTSRLLYYMALPRLYENVTLRSYSEIRYVDGRPEGYGSGSPFSMGLNALVSRSVTSYVQNFSVVGEWRETDIEDYSKGRVPDNSMMLNIAIRAALDKMQILRSFGWELNTKPTQAVYQGIASRPSLTSLTLRFPRKRIPRPTVLVPPIPNLKALKVYDIDPLCYPDDISVLLVTSKKLEDLTLHWNPRMRDVGEESVNLMTYFGRCLTSRYSLPVKRLALYNLYTRNSGDLDDCIANERLEEISLLNCVGSGDPMTVFLDDTWRINQPNKVPTNLKMMRGDMLGRPHVNMLARFQGLERLYIVSARRTSRSKSNSATATPTTPSPSSSSPSSNSMPQESVNLASDYLAAIEAHHRTMRHLLLSDQWILGIDVIKRLVKSCPNLEQFGLAIKDVDIPVLREIMAHAPKIYAIRILVRPGSEFYEKFESIDDEMHEFAISQETWRPEYKNLKWLGVSDMVFQLGAVMNLGTKRAKAGGEPLPMRIVKRVPKDTVKDIEIWKMNSLDL